MAGGIWILEALVLTAKPKRGIKWACNTARRASIGHRTIAAQCGPEMADGDGVGKKGWMLLFRCDCSVSINCSLQACARRRTMTGT